MKKSIKIALLVATILIGVGSLFFLGAAIAMGGDFSKLSRVQYEQKRYEIEGAFTDISIDVGASDVRFALAEEGEESYVTCMEAEKITYTVEVKDGQLRVVEVDARRWYEHIGIFIGRQELVVYLPQTDWNKVNVSVQSGDLTIPKNFTFAEASLEAQSGDIETYANVAGALSVKTQSGDIAVGQVCVQSLSAWATSGDIDLKNVEVTDGVTLTAVSGSIEASGKAGSLHAETASGDIELRNFITDGETRLKCSSGDIELSACDAASYDMRTSSGDIYGTVLTSKIFQAYVKSGNAKVPTSTEGGVCRAETASGNIRLDIYRE